jgi:hypothetical protein
MAMLIITAKVPRPKASLWIAAAAFFCCAALVLALVPPAARQAAASAQISHKGIRTHKDQVEYLDQYGWQTSPEPSAVEELSIPEQFDERYDQYLQLQREQGFELEKYAGKRVKRYTYQILNHPSGESGVIANLLIYKKTVVGGEVLSPKLNGFLHGLSMP